MAFDQQLPGFRLPIQPTALPQPIQPINKTIAQSVGGGAAAQGGITAKLSSLDTNLVLYFARSGYLSPPSRSSRRGSAKWNEAGVAQASPQFIEYQETAPNVRVYRCVFRSYIFPGGVANDFEAELAILDQLKNRVPGKKRAHRCLWVQGVQRFKCVLEEYEVPIELIAQSGGALLAPDVTIQLKQIP